MMKQVYWASYTGVHRSLHGLVNLGIRRATQSRISHSEVVLCDAGQTPFTAPALCMSASGVDGGVRAKTMRLNPDKWAVLRLDFVAAPAVQMAFECIDGQGYDYLGTGRFAAPLLLPLRQHPRRCFCSEAGLFLLSVAPGDEWRFDPASAHALLEQLGGQPVSGEIV